MCAAIRSPLRKISTVRAVSRTSTRRGQAVGHAVIVAVDLDVIIEADPRARHSAKT